MTLHVTREGQQVTIHGNNGLHVQIENSRVHAFAVSEDTAHLRHFWGELGEALKEAERGEDTDPPAEGGF